MSLSWDDLPPCSPKPLFIYSKCQVFDTQYVLVCPLLAVTWHLHTTTCSWHEQLYKNSPYILKKQNTGIGINLWNSCLNLVVGKFSFITDLCLSLIAFPALEQVATGNKVYFSSSNESTDSPPSSQNPGDASWEVQDPPLPLTLSWTCQSNWTADAV